jgi:hypothetical protein
LILGCSDFASLTLRTPGPGRHPYFSAGIASASAMICRPAILNSGAHPPPASVIESCAAASRAIALIVSKRLVIRICTRSYHSLTPRCTATSILDTIRLYCNGLAHKDSVARIYFARANRNAQLR